MKVFTRNTPHLNLAKTITLFSAFLLMSFFGSAQLATWSGPWSGVTASPRAATTKATNVNVATLARVNLTGTSSSTRFSSSNWTASNYLIITITANTGFVLNLNGESISLIMGSSGTGPNLYTLRSSVDAYASSLGTYTPSCSGQQAGSVTLPSSGFNGLTSITFRVVGSTTGCSSTFAPGGTGGPSAITVNGAVTVAPIVPTVSTTAVTLITTTDAVSGGDVTSDGGAAVSARGVYFGTSANPTSGTTETGTTGIFTSNLTPLSVNTEYFYRAYAINSAGTGFGTESSFYTLANVPGTPTVNGATSSSLDITLNVNGNPAITTFAIRETGSGNYVQANGSLGAAPVWRTNSQWGTVTVTGLAASTTYSFDVKARNGSNVETNFSATGSGTTLAAATPTLTATTISDFGNVCLNVTSGANSFTVTASNLNNSNITISSPNPAYTFSLDNLSYQASINQPQAGGSYDFPVYVKFTPTATGSNNSTISIGGGGASSISVNVNGGGINTIGTATTGAASSIASASATLNGSFTEVCSTITGYGFEYSLTNNFANGTGTQAPSTNQSSGVFSAGISGLGSGLTYYFKAYASDGITTVYGNQQSFTTTQITLDAPVATAATAITSGSFVANWNAVTNATGYRLDVGTSPNFLGTPASFAAWTFPTNGTIVTPSSSNSNNAAQSLSTNGGSIGDVTGATTRAATANAWSSGSGTKYWQIDLNTTGLFELTISSKQRSSGTGPRDFKLQYSVGGGAYTDVPSGSITVADNFITGVVTNLSLPSACDNQTAISIRWIMTSNTSVNGGSVGSGTSRIDDIDVQGKSAFFLAGYENRAVSGTSETVSPLTPGTTYYYRVRATNGAVASANSNVISASTCTDLPVSVSIAANPGSTICAGTSVRFTATPVNGGTTPTYQWYNGATPISGATASTYTSTTLANGDAISVQLTSSETCTTGNPATSSIINITVNPILEVSVNISANPGSTICTGTSVTFTATPVNGGTSPAYQWYNGVTPIGGETASTYTTTTLEDEDAISVQLTSSETCTTGNPATSNIIYMTVDPILEVSVNISANPGSTICAGTSVTFTATPVNGGRNPACQWYNGVTPISGATALTYTSTTLANGDAISVQLTSNSNCITGNNTATSNTINMTVNPFLPVSVTIAANPGSTICAGTSVTFTATPVNGGTTPTYQWYNGATPISGATASTYTSTTLANGDAISVQLTSNSNCITGNNTATSNTINMTVNALVPVSVSIAENPGSTICAGTSVTFTATPVNGGTSPAYQWYNGVTPIVGETASTYTTTTLLNGDAITVQLTSNESGCVPVNPASSNVINMTVNPLPATAGPISGPTDVCPLIGSVTPTVYSIDPVPGVSSYQWAIPVGTTLVSGQGTTSISVTFDNSFALTNSQFKVRTVSPEGCIGVPSSIIVLKNVPGIPLAINGPTNACPFIGLPGTVTYSIASVQYATSYTWSVQGTGISILSGQGTTSIEVSYASNFNTGVIRVVANSNCGSRSPRTLNVSRFTPQPPVAINGQTNVCSFIGTTTQVTYSVDPVENATSYVWTVPSNVTLVSGQGTTSINVRINSGFSTSILKVKSVSNCFTSGERQLTLTAAITSIPGVITGPNNACSFIGTANTATYSIRKVTSATSYVWTVPAGMTISSHPGGTGVNDTIITVAFNNSFVSGTSLEVQAVNCNLSAPRSLAIFRTVLSAPGLISGPTNVCELMVSSTNPSGSVATYRIPKLANALSYNWSITGNASITSHPNGTGVNDTIVEVLFNSSFTGGNVQVSASNGCGISSVRSLSVSRLNAGNPGVIAVVLSAACPNRVYTYSLASIPSNASSLVWTIPASGTLVSGAGTTSITVSYPSTPISGVVTVRAFNNCSSSNTRSVTINLPACPIVIRNTTERNAQQIFTDKMTMDIFPNPTTSQFNLQVISAGKEKVTVRILDIQGRLVRKFTVMPFETTTFGQDLKAGSYIIETTQGTEKLTRRVMKF